ncbi:HAMP domain-containing protein [Novosphingobium flavum]|uniref:histidine kinase n=1 Tax=Novosphingobium aerophilum TaxID=2839843 RepID=A0A7X1KC21_9SPHN|nr:ATP-binding protein [Novosphingobium aerophilum]MBC2651755.1 HAMP domain-containing protein [Novosphingobium aerophilum]MBC2662057.1 HAMP domain-containing protein [Novosphingobium aerophilum]
MTSGEGAPRWRREWRGLSLTASLLAITLLILIADFAANSLMFERARTFVVNSEEVAHAAEHLVVARRVLAAEVPERRPAVARQLSTNRVRISWHPRRRAVDSLAGLPSLRDEIVRAQRELATMDLRLVLVPLSRGGGMAGSVLLPDGSELEFRSRRMVSWSLNWDLLLRFSLPSLIFFAVAWWLVRTSIAPLQRLVAAMRQVGTDDMVLLPEAGQSEVRQLIGAFNRMHERIRQLLANRTQTLLAVGHDLRTPLARLQLRVDGANLDEQTREEMGEDIAEMSELLASLQAFVESGQESGPARAIDLAAMVRSQVDGAIDGGLDAVYIGPDSLEVLAHPAGLRRAIANLLQNAHRYAGSAEVSLRASGGWVELTVADRGPGIPTERLDDVRQPFTRLDTARGRNTRGMGLGLAIVDRVIQAEGGRLDLANRAGGGLAATLWLPQRASDSNNS